MDDYYEVNITKANYLLQSKTGKGPMDPKTLQRAQSVIDKNNIDFIPIAEQKLNQLQNIIKNLRKDRDSVQQPLQSLALPIMHLKANAATFKYDLVTTLAGMVLNVVDNLSQLNDDLLDIVETQYETIRVIIDKRIEGTGGEYGERLQSELQEAIKRFVAKHNL